MSRLFCILVAGCSLLVAPLCAQSTWTAVSSGTTRNLWGVCHGFDQFVAVGEEGTILTSPDGLTWTARTSGTTRWLTAVAYGYGHYVAVGDGTTVLTSRDGITWDNLSTRLGLPTKNRLNAVRFEGDAFQIYGERHTRAQLTLPRQVSATTLEYGAGSWWRSSAFGLGRTIVGGEIGLAAIDRSANWSTETPALPGADIRNVGGVEFYRGAFYAVGAGGTIVTSIDGTTWPRQPSGTSEDLHALTAFNHTLVAIGARGTILSQDSAERWQLRASPTTEILLGIAAHTSTTGPTAPAVIVGGSGTILRATADAQAPAIVQQPVSIAETNEGAVTLSVRATGSGPLSYQWYHNGRLLSGAQYPTLRFAPFTVYDAGTYSVVVFNSAGRVTSDTVRVESLPRPVSIVDQSFQLIIEEGYSISTLLPLPDETLLVALTPTQAETGKPARLLKLQPNGQPVASGWNSPPFAGAERSTDGRPRSISITSLLRLSDGRIVVGGTFDNLDGRPQRNLVRLLADGTFDNTFLPPDSVTALPPLSLALQSRDRLLVANGGTVPLRLDLDGQPDPTFQPFVLPPEFPVPNSQRDWRVLAVQVTRDDRILLGADVGLTRTLIAPYSNSTVIRLQPDGALDSSFTQLRWPGYGVNLRALDDGGALVAGRLQENAEGNYTQNAIDGRIWRLRSDGTPLPGYPSLRIPLFGATYLYPDGQALYATSNPQNPTRLTALGEVDPTFTGGIGNPSRIAVSAAGSVYVSGAFKVYNGRLAPGLARLVATPNPSPNPPRIVAFNADTTPRYGMKGPVVAYGQSIGLSVDVVGSADLTYEWQTDTGRVLAVTHQPFYEVPILRRYDETRFRVVVRNSRGSATSDTIIATVLPNAPVIAQQPTRLSTQTGREAFLRLVINDTAGAVTVQWYRDGVPLPNPGPAWFDALTYPFDSLRSVDAGTYTATITNVLGQSVTSAPIVLAIDKASRFVNLSTRVVLAPDEPRAIIGFTLSGESTRTILVRGAGPALARFGVAAPLAHPRIELFDSQGISRSNSSGPWSLSNRPFFERTGAFPFEEGSADSALVANLAPGAYTVVLTAPPDEYGPALVEIYEADNVAATMSNLSTRAHVTPGSPAIAGFVIRGQVAKPVLLRAAGPSLTAFGVGNALRNPRLVLRNERGDILGSNDDWDSALRAAMNSVGAFPFDGGSRDAALRLSLPPGNYTAAIESADGQSGVGLIEVYELPP